LWHRQVLQGSKMGWKSVSSKKLFFFICWWYLKVGQILESPTMLTNIRLGWECLSVTNTLSLFVSVMKKKVFITCPPSAQARPTSPNSKNQRNSWFEDSPIDQNEAGILKKFCFGLCKMNFLKKSLLFNFGNCVFRRFQPLKDPNQLGFLKVLHRTLMNKIPKQ